jgi:vacuolar-type H+-ATPase subunit I/STV1
LVREQRIVSPLKYEHLSPLNSKQGTSPGIKESRLGPSTFVPIRATLKNLIQSKASPPHRNE